MEESSIVLTKESTGKVNVVASNVAMDDLALMLGVFAGLVVTEAIKRGMSVDDVKDAMLDIFLAATAGLDEKKVDDIIKGDTLC